MEAAGVPRSWPQPLPLRGLLPQAAAGTAVAARQGQWQQLRREAQRRLWAHPTATAFGLTAATVACRGTCRRHGGRLPARRALAAAAMARQPLPVQPLPPPLCARDGLAKGALPEDVFTWDTVTKRMPKILDAVLEALPPALAGKASLLEGVRALQLEMREGAALRWLEAADPWVGAQAWNEDLAPFIKRGKGWHEAPWWVVENYMYKRLLQELALCGPEAAGYDPFESQKTKALAASVAPYEASLRPLLALVAAAEAQPQGHPDRRAALEAALVRSLWGNQADLSLSAGKVESANGGDPGQVLSDGTSLALELVQGAAGRPIVLVLDNHGLEVLCDLVLADAILRLVGPSSVSLHVKDSPVFVSDVTQEDVPGILAWLDEHDSALAGRLRMGIADSRLSVVPSPFYTTARTFWQLPADLTSIYTEAAVVILKGDANYRRLLGDLHWPYDTDFGSYVRSFWPCPGLVSLRTMKSGVALGISEDKQAEAKAAHPNDWLTCGVYGQVLASSEAV